MTLLKDAFRQQRSLIAFTFIALVVTIAVGLIKGAAPGEFLFLLSSLKMFALMTLSFFGALIFVLYGQSVFENIRAGQGMRGVERRFNQKIDPYLTPQTLVMGAVGMMPLIMTGWVLSVGKSLIPYMTSYQWDPLFMEWDRIVHFGFYPHELIMPLIERLHLSGFFNFVYLSWFAAMFGCNGYVLFCERNRARRSQYLWTNVISWMLIGVVLATVFASVGPVYLHHFYPDLNNPYDGLRDHLRTVHNSGVELNVVRMSPVLLELVQNDRVVDMNGISAMPSMHVAISWLIVLYMFAVNRLMGWLAVLFFVLIQIGSVCLAWHYAIDGYAAVILVTAIWWVCGRFINTRPH